jgi:hypothetical protein
MMPETVPESPDPLFYLKVISYLCGMENEEKWSLFWILFIGIGGFVLLFLVN